MKKIIIFTILAIASGRGLAQQSLYGAGQLVELRSGSLFTDLSQDPTTNTVDCGQGYQTTNCTFKAGALNATTSITAPQIYGGSSSQFQVNGSGVVTAPSVIPGVLYSAAGTALPTCAAGIQGETAVVKDATSPTYMGAYTSGGAITAAVICSYNGTTYSWLTH